MAAISPGGGDALSSTEHTAETKAQRSFLSISLSCRDLFISVFHSLENIDDGGALKVMVRDQAGRFNLWTSNVGAMAQSLASLDHRLRDLPDIAELVRVHLCHIEDLLSNAEFATDASNELSSSSQQHSPKTEIESTLSYVSESIDWLHRVANTIRRASAARQNQKAIQPTPEDDEDNATSTERRKFFHCWIKRDFPATSDEFCSRLVSTMILRRRAVLYRRKRQADLAELDQKKTSDRDQAASLALAASSLAMKKNLLAGPTTSAVFPAVRPSLISTQYTATTIDPAAFRQTSTTQSVISQAPTIDLVGRSNDLVPAAPEVPSSARDFVCPFCCMILPAQKARNRHEWAAHVKRDLDPYVCAFFPCEHGETIFGTSTEWLAHMKQAHRMRWRCISKKHKVAMFPSRAEYVAHMTAEHGSAVTDAQLALLADTSVRPLKNIFDSCPFCSGFKDIRGKRLEEHVAHHLQHIALMSLPLPDDDGVPTKNDINDILPSNVYGNASHANMSTCEATSVLSRSTMRTSFHDMPSATFPDEAGIIVDMKRPWDTLIPDANEQDYMELVQRVRMEKLKSANVGLPLTSDEQREDRILARFIARTDDSGSLVLASSPSAAFEKIAETVTELPVAGQEKNHIFLVPHKRDPNFVGRDTELEDARKYIYSPKDINTSALAVVGPSGIGKTAFATELAYRIHDNEPSCVCIWISLLTFERLHTSYLTAASALSIPSSSLPLPEGRLFLQVHEALLNLNGRRWVLILDDMMDNHLHLSPLLPDFRDLLYAGSGSIVIISPYRLSEMFFYDIHVPLAPLESTDALQLLQFHLRDHDLISSRTDTASILSSTGHSPLAIILAAAYINRHMLSLEEYQTLLADNARHVDNLHMGSEIRHLAAVIFVSLTVIFQRDDIATDCLLALACTSGREIHREHLFVDGSRDTEDAIATLKAYGLITTQPCNLIIDTVGPLCLVMRLVLSTLGLEDDWVNAVIAVLRRILSLQEYENDPGRIQNGASWRPYLSHLTFALKDDSVARRIAETGSMDLRELQSLWSYGLQDYTDGDHVGADKAFRRVMKVCRGLLEKHERKKY